MNLDRSNWKRVRFGNVVRNVNESVKNPATAGIDRVIAMDHLDPSNLQITRWGDIADGTTFTRRVRPGQTLFGKRRAYQRKAAYADFSAICSGDILVFEADEAELLPELLPFLVQSEGFYAKAVGTSAGSLSPRTNWKDLSSYEFMLPPLDQQQAIANLLWKITDHSRRIGLEITSLQMVRDRWLGRRMRQLLTDGHAQRFDLFVESSAYGPRFSSNLYSESGEYRMLRTTDMDVRGDISYENMPRAELNDDFSGHLLQEGDFLISRSGSCGVPAVFSAMVPPEKVVPGAFLIRFRLTDGLVPSFIRAYFNSEPGRELTTLLAQGGVQKNIRGSALLASEVPVPAVTVQKAVIFRLDEIEIALSALLTEQDSLGKLGTSIKMQLGSTS